MTSRTTLARALTPAATGQFARPAADRTDGNWLNSAGTPDNVALTATSTKRATATSDYIRKRGHAEQRYLHDRPEQHPPRRRPAPSPCGSGRGTVVNGGRTPPAAYRFGMTNGTEATHTWRAAGGHGGDHRAGMCRFCCGFRLGGRRPVRGRGQHGQTISVPAQRWRLENITTTSRSAARWRSGRSPRGQLHQRLTTKPTGAFEPARGCHGRRPQWWQRQRYRRGGYSETEAGLQLVSTDLGRATRGLPPGLHAHGHQRL